jgi:hypothetical protein
MNQCRIRVGHQVWEGLPWISGHPVMKNVRILGLPRLRLSALPLWG